VERFNTDFGAGTPDLRRDNRTVVLKVVIWIVYVRIEESIASLVVVALATVALCAGNS
jgi:hypothetical protein